MLYTGPMQGLVPVVITPYAIILALGAAQGVFLAIAILSAPIGSSTANRFLAALLLVFVADLIDEFLLATGYFHAAPRLTAINWAVDLLFGPLIYGYTLALARPATTSASRWKLHLTPFFVAILVVIVLMPTYPARQFAAQVSGDGTLVLAIVEGTLALSGMISIAWYIVCALGIVKQHRKQLHDFFSFEKGVSLRWLQTVLWVMLGLFALYLLTAIVQFTTGNTEFESVSLYPAIVTSIYVMGFLGLRQPQIFTTDTDRLPPARNQVPENYHQHRPTAMPDERAARPDNTAKYAKSAMSSAQSALLLDEITDLMERERLYLVNNLSLPSLAIRLGTSTNLISQAINEAAEINFFDFVNQFRINHARQLLRSTQKNVLEIAMESGFNSKSAFYSAFAKLCSSSPTAYRNSVKKSSSIVSN